MEDADRSRESELIGAIYDCALDPGAWPTALRAVCERVEGHSAGIVVLDFKGSGDRLVRDWGPTTDWGQRMAPVLDSVKHIHRQFLGIGGARLDEPIVLPRDLSPSIDVFGTPFYQQWAAPQRIHQVLETVALSEPTRLGLFCVTRQDQVGSFTEAQVALMRRLAPHVRRAVTISDLLDLRTVERDAFLGVIDGIPSGICVVGSEGQILRANAAARKMLESGAPVRNVDGRLKANGAAATAALLEAITAAQKDEAAVPAGGIAVPLSTDPKRPAIAYVLPLARGESRTRLVPAALAAVFINTNSPATFVDIEGIARSFEFTHQETQLCHQLVLGHSLGESAEKLGIAENTARTHLKNIFYKAGVSRQVDLVSLLLRLISPVRPRE